MLSITPNRYKIITLRKQYPIPILLCNAFILMVPLATLILYILFTSCPAQFIDENKNTWIPAWIVKRSHRNLFPSVQNGLLISRDEEHYDHIKHGSIFVSIAAFRDKECRNTILQVIERARHPDRLRFGIFTQNNITDPDCADFRDVLNCDPHHDYAHLYMHDDDIPEGANTHGNRWKQSYRHKPHVLCGRLWQIKTDRIHWKDGLGPTYGRYRAELFYEDEDYVLQMDSHTAFVQDWDVILIKMHSQLNNDYGVITTYPKPLRYPTLWHWEAPSRRRNSDMYVICGTQILEKKVTKSFKLQPAKTIKNAGKPILTAFFAAGFSFQRGHRLVNVPYDPYAAFLFDGEEMSMAARMWTHGYDFYSPNHDIVGHYYDKGPKRRSPHVGSNRESHHLRDLSEKRLNYMWGLWEIRYPKDKDLRIEEIAKKCELRELAQYGLGRRRTLQQYWKWAGIDPINKNITVFKEEYYAQGGLPYVPY
eukprot:190869_1